MCFGYEEIYDSETGDIDRVYYATSEVPCSHHDCDQ